MSLLQAMYGGTVGDLLEPENERQQGSLHWLSRAWWQGISAIIGVLALIVTVVQITQGGGDSKPSLGPEVPPPTGYGQIARLLSADGFAIEERPTTTQAGDLVLAAHPSTSTNSQRWAFWYGNQPDQPGPKAVLLEAYRTNGIGKPSQGAVIDHPSGSTVLQQVDYSATQFWTFHKASDPWYRITDYQQLCLTAVQVDAPLQVRTCDGDAGQRWKVTDITNGGA